jgi:uncharacterized protein YggE
MTLYKYSLRILSAASLLVLLLTAGGALAQDSGPVFSISVDGVGTAVAAPDIAYVEMGAEQISTDLQGTVAEITAKSNAMIEAITALGVNVSDIQTGGVEIIPQDLLDPVTNSLTGELVYRVRSTLRIVVRDISLVQDIIDAGVDAGANRMGGVTFGLNDVTELESRARNAAIENAYQRANQLADGLGMTITRPIVVTETLVNSGFPTALEVSAGRGARLSSRDAEESSGQFIVTVQIRVTFRTQ